MTNYIITGACGHLAQSIINQLKGTTCKVFGLILPHESAQSSHNITYYHGDITKPSTLDRVFLDAASDDTIVIHTAGIISLVKRMTQVIYNTNVLGTKNIIDKCKQFKTKRLVYISSVHAIEERPKGQIIAEVVHFVPDKLIGAYAKTKAMASNLVLDAVAKGLDAVIVQPSGILGAGSGKSNHINQMITDYIEGRLPAGVRGGYDFVDVIDVAKGCIAAAQRGVKGACYILSGAYHTAAELLNMVAKRMNLKQKIMIPLWVAKLMAPLFELYATLLGKRPLFTQYSLHVLGTNASFSHEKATKELSYSPRPIENTVDDILSGLKGARCRQSD